MTKAVERCSYLRTLGFFSPRTLSSTSVLCSRLLQTSHPASFQSLKDKKVRGYATFKEELKADTKTFFANYPDRTSYKELALLCSYSYMDPLPPTCGSFELLAVKSCPENAYKGVAVIDKKTRRMVLIHRGTVFTYLEAWEQNRHNIALHELTEHLAAAYAFALEMIERAKENDCTLEQTGHSLGAYLAEIVAFLSALEKKPSILPTVTFDSPGTYTIMKRLQVKVKEEKFILKKLDILSILSSCNPINTLNEHLRPFRCIPEIEKPEAYKGEIGHARYVGDSHFLDNIIPAFDDTTGFPEPMFKVYKWPLSYRESSPSTGVFKPVGDGTQMTDHIRGVVNLAKLLLSDYRNFNKEEYSKWYQKAQESNTFHPEAHKTFDRLVLKHAGSYHVEEYNPRTTLELAQLSLELRRFFKDLKNFRKTADRLIPDEKFVIKQSYGMDPRILDILFQCTMDKTSLHIPEGHITAFDLRRYLTRLHSIHPEAFKELKRRCAARIRGNSLTEGIERVRYAFQSFTRPDASWVKRNVYPELSMEDLMMPDV